MQINQPSEQKMVCRKDGKMRELIRGIAETTVFWIVIGFLVSIWIPSKQNYNPSIGIITYAAFCFFAIAFTHDHIAIFDLDAQSIQNKQYFILFKKYYCQNYDIANVRNIVVEKKHESANYIIVIKQYSGKDIYIPSPDSPDILFVDAEAQKIRDFLGLDVRNRNPLIR